MTPLCPPPPPPPAPPEDNGEEEEEEEGEKRGRGQKGEGGAVGVANLTPPHFDPAPRS